ACRVEPCRPSTACATNQEHWRLPPPDYTAGRNDKEYSMPSRGPWIDHFPDNFLWSNATLILKGMAPYGVVSLEEMDRACEKLRKRWDEPDRGKAWFEEWR